MEKIFLVPKSIVEKAKQLRKERRYKESLAMLERNVVEFDINEIGGTMSAKMNKDPRSFR